MTATDGFHLSLMQQEKEENCANVLFVKLKHAQIRLQQKDLEFY